MPKSNDIMLPLFLDVIFHIYSRDKEKRIIFFKVDNFTYLMKRLQDYLNDYSDNYTYGMSDNHFHIFKRRKYSENILEAVNYDDNFKLDIQFVHRLQMPYPTFLTSERVTDVADLTAVNVTNLDLSDVAFKAKEEDLLNLPALWLGQAGLTLLPMLLKSDTH